MKQNSLPIPAAIDHSINLSTEGPNSFRRFLIMNPEIINVNGGAIALGHPLGCTGAKLTTTLLHEMGRRKLQYGMVSMCIGGGMGAAALFEKL